jgi:hypothetical protein
MSATGEVSPTGQFRQLAPTFATILCPVSAFSAGAVHIMRPSGDCKCVYNGAKWVKNPKNVNKEIAKSLTYIDSGNNAVSCMKS